MICPRCGSEVAAASSRCSRCAAPLDQTIATGVLTPPPAPTDGSVTDSLEQDAPTMFLEPDAPTSYQRSTLEDKPTFFQSPSASGVIPASFVNGPLEPGQAFGPRYRIVRTLGVGGMGAVYEAWDSELGVTVALKVIRPEVMADPTAAADIERRFKRELLLARQVTHKNVVRIHDLGDINGLKFITMSYVEGADLATILRRDGRLPVERVLRVARSVALGLVEAHKQGVVHRDLKPANIMITADDDEAMIMDFGIARSTGGSNAARRSGVRPPPGAVPGAGTIVRNLNRPDLMEADGTVFGAVVGTVEYMAPEQAQGHKVDQRADIYAFGLILYDLLVGESRAAKALNPIIELQGRMLHAPPAIRSIVPEVPEPVGDIIGRCLEPDPEKRFQTSEELSAALALLDDQGLPIPIPPRFSKRVIAAAAAAVIALVTGTWWFTRTPPPPKKHDPVTLIVADFQNTTGDAAFEHTLEPVLRRALEGAGFISAHDRSRIRAAFNVPTPEKLDDVAARQLAVKQGVGVVLAGAIAPRDGGFDIAVTATQAVSGKVLADAKSRASNKSQVLETVTKVASTIRKALGDETKESERLFAMRTVSATSLEVVGQYAAGTELQAKGKFDEARASFLKAVELDPKFGLGYQALSVLSGNQGKLQEAEAFAKQALQFLDEVTDRERLSIRANYYRMTGDLLQCDKEYSELVARFAADATAHNQRAICLAKLRNMRGAIDEMRLAVQILPNRSSYRANLALFASYAGDFQTAEREFRDVQEPTAVNMLALAYSQIGQGQLQEAAATYEKTRSRGARGPSVAASGLGDLALYEGRFSDAVKIFEDGAAADFAAKNPDSAAMKLASLAYTHLMRGQNGPAAAAAEKALQTSQALPVRFLAARVLVETGSLAPAQKVAGELSSQLAVEPHAYGKIIEGEIALKKRDFGQAVKILNEANGILDTWLGHFDLGRAYLEGRAYPQAGSEFDRCIKRRGEALSLFDEDPTYGYLPPVYYFQGRASQGLGTAGFADFYREYLKVRGTSTEDPLLPEVRRRAGN